MVALTKNNSKANVAGVVDTINKRVSGKCVAPCPKQDLLLFFTILI